MAQENIENEERTGNENSENEFEVENAYENNKNEVENLDEKEQVEEPKIGQLFDSVYEVEKYYRSYGKGAGFEVCRRTSSRGQDRELKYITFTCSRFGKPSSKSRFAFKFKPTTKTDCKAKLNACLLSNGKWAVSSIVLEHNHEFTSPSKRRFHRSSRNISSRFKKRLETNDIVGVRLNKSFNSFVVEAGGHANLPFTERDARNFIQKVRCLRLGEGDATALQKYFMKMQADNSNFFYIIDINEKGRLRNVFWADARSRAVYEEFGDVVTFDTTYLTNKYDMPFAPFVGMGSQYYSDVD